MLEKKITGVMQARPNQKPARIDLRVEGIRKKHPVVRPPPEKIGCVEDEERGHEEGTPLEKAFPPVPHEMKETEGVDHAPLGAGHGGQDQAEAGGARP